MYINILNKILKNTHLMNIKIFMTLISTIPFFLDFAKRLTVFVTLINNQNFINSHNNIILLNTATFNISLFYVSVPKPQAYLRNRR